MPRTLKRSDSGISATEVSHVLIVAKLQCLLLGFPDELLRSETDLVRVILEQDFSCRVLVGHGYERHWIAKFLWHCADGCCCYFHIGYLSLPRERLDGCGLLLVCFQTNCVSLPRGSPTGLKAFSALYISYCGSYL